MTKQFQRRLLPALCAGAVFLLGPWAASAQMPLPPAPRRAAPATNITVDGNEAMFTTMCALLAAGFESNVSAENWHPLRARLREQMQHQQGPAVDAVREIGNAVRDINDVTSNIAGAVGQQDAATREISANAQLAAHGNETLVTNIASLSSAIGETSNAATSVLSASSELTSTAETLSREVDKFFRNLRADPLDGHDDRALRTGTAGN